MASFQSIQWENAVCVIEPTITAAGIHVSPVDPSFPMDVLFFATAASGLSGVASARKFRIAPQEIGAAIYRVGDREILLNQGDLFAIGRDLPHSIQDYLSPSIATVALYFHPDVILANDSVGENAECMIPFRI